MSVQNSPADVQVSLTELLRDKRMFIVARRADKTPINPLHPDPASAAANSDATDPSTWMSSGIALGWVGALGPEFGVGIVLSPNAPLPLACIDIDGAHDGTKWSTLTHELVAMFEGAYLEVSRSGRGLHIIFTYLGEFPPHAKKNTALSIELYHDKRYILLGTPQRGTPFHNGMAEAAAVIPRYFPPNLNDATGCELTDAPVAAWHGPDEDEALIQIALRSKRSFAGVLRDGATFKDLWTGDVEKLAKVFRPADSSKGTYDASGADLSLANKLAFFTGNNGARMERMMRVSALTRDKWHREDYMRGTILKACAATKQWYNDGKGVTRDAPIPEANAESGGIGLDDFRYYAPDNTFIFVPQREMWSANGVDSNIKPWPNGNKPTLWITQARQVHQITWIPGHSLTIPDRLYTEGTWEMKPGHNIFNMYKGPTIPVGDPSKAGPWLALLEKLYSEEAHRAHLIQWFAHRRQRPHEKMNHALVLGGAMGIGKDTLIDPLGHAVGTWNFQSIEPKNLFDSFNPWVRRVVLQISEARDMGEGSGASSISRYALYEKSKDLIAAPPNSLYCNEKGLRQYNVPNLVGVIFTTNHPDGLWLPAGDRRHFVIWSEVERGEFDKKYFLDLYAWYAAEGYGHIAAYLDSVDLSDFDPKRPPPETSAFLQMVSLGRAPEESELADVLDALGRPPAITVDTVNDQARKTHPDFAGWLTDKRHRRQVPGRFDAAGYSAVRNSGDRHDGQWRVGAKRVTIYGRKDLPERDRQAAAQALCVPPPPGAVR